MVCQCEYKIDMVLDYAAMKALFFLGRSNLISFTDTYTRTLYNHPHTHTYAQTHTHWTSVRGFFLNRHIGDRSFSTVY